MLSLAFFLTLASPLLATEGPVTYTSMHVFGDGVCSTTDSPGGSPYYGNRYCNGRVWVEVLAAWQGIPYLTSQNVSYFGHDSDELLTNIAAMSPPGDAGTALFIVWSANADFVEQVFATNPPYNSSDIPAWTTFINASVQNHEDAIEALYAKGARTIVMPTAADITSAPFFSLSPGDQSFIRARIADFNVAFQSMLDGLLPTQPGLKVPVPDVFTLLDDVLANPGDYDDMVNPGIDALTDGQTSFTGPGADYVFWDFLHPTAKMQFQIAELAQQLIASPGISDITTVAEGCQLDLFNVPVGRNGLIQGSTNLVNWTTDLNFNSGTTAQSVVVPATGST